MIPTHFFALSHHLSVRLYVHPRLYIHSIEQSTAKNLLRYKRYIIFESHLLYYDKIKRVENRDKLNINTCIWRIDERVSEWACKQPRCPNSNRENNGIDVRLINFTFRAFIFSIYFTRRITNIVMGYQKFILPLGNSSSQTCLFRQKFRQQHSYFMRTL